jgi:hypothetical protein
MEEAYKKLAKELVEKVRKINPEAVVISNWIKDPTMVTALIESYHLNIGKDFLKNPFDYLRPENFF